MCPSNAELDTPDAVSADRLPVVVAGRLLNEIRRRTPQANAPRHGVLDAYREALVNLWNSPDWSAPLAPDGVRALARRWGVKLDDDDMPTAPPQVVCGVVLDNPYESAEFEQAKRLGVLVKTPDMPVRSFVPEAWRRWCEQQGRPCVIREEKSPVGSLKP